MQNVLMDIRINITFEFENELYHADILILNLLSTIQNFFYVVHLFDDGLLAQFPRRHIFIAKDKKFMPVKTNTTREEVLVHAIQKAIVNHRNNPFGSDAPSSIDAQRILKGT